MNLLTVLLFSFFIKTQSDNRKIEIKQVYLFKYDFWYVSNGFINKDESYVYSLDLLDEKNEEIFPFFNANDRFNLDPSNGSKYVELSEKLVKKMFPCFNSSKVDKKSIRRKFLTTGSPVKDYEELRNYKAEKARHLTNMWVEKLIKNDGTIDLKIDKENSRIIAIKEEFKRLMGKKLYEFDEFIYKFGFKNPLEELEKNKDFELCYFPNSYECYENLRVFLKNSKFFGITNRFIYEDDSSETTIMNPTKFMQRINKMIKKDLEELKGVSGENWLYKLFINLVGFFYESEEVSNKKAALKSYKFLLKKYFEVLICEMQQKKIFFNIGGKYDVDYYFKELYNLVSGAIKEFQEKHDIDNSEDKDIIYKKICGSFYDSLLKLQKKIIAELFESDFVHEKISKLLCKEVKTPEYIEAVESIIFDYINMLTYLSGFCHRTGGSCYSIYRYPRSFNRDHECKIINCLKIKLKTSIYNGFGKIEAFNKKGEEVEFESGVHFFLKHLSNNEFYCTSEVLRKLNIKKIKITTLRKDFCEIVEVNKFISY